MRTFRLPDRSGGVLSRAVGEEFVVVDPATGTAHALSGAAARVWAATGSGALPELSEHDLAGTVAELTALGLLVPARGLTRRDLLARGGLVAAGVGVASIALPMADAAASTTVTVTVVSGVPITIPKGAHDIKLTLAGAAGGVAQDRGGTPGSGGIVTYQPGITLASASTVTIVIGNQGGGGVGGNAATAPGGTGTYSGGQGGGAPNLTSGGDLAGGGGGATTASFTGGLSAKLIAGGGGGAGNGYGSSNDTSSSSYLLSKGGDGGSVVAGVGQAGTAGATYTTTKTFTGGAGGSAGGATGAAAGANGGAGTLSITDQTNGGGGGGGGAVGGGAATNGTTTTGGGGGGAGSSGYTLTSPASGVAPPVYGPAATGTTNGYATLSYVTP